MERLYAAKAQALEGQIGAESLTLLLDAYANGLPRAQKQAQGAFRGAMAAAEAKGGQCAEALGSKPGKVLQALKRAVGPAVYRDLMEERLALKAIQCHIIGSANSYNSYRYTLHTYVLTKIYYEYIYIYCARVCAHACEVWA